MRHHSRTGASLLELMVCITLMSSLVVIARSVINPLSRLTTNRPNEYNASAEREEFFRTLRSDAAQASNAVLSDSDQLLLTSSNPIRYQIEEDLQLVRTINLGTENESSRLVLKSHHAEFEILNSLLICRLTPVSKSENSQQIPTVLTVRLDLLHAGKVSQ